MSQRQAIRHVQNIVTERAMNGVHPLIWKVFSMKFLTTVILKLIRRKIADEGLVTLIARALKAGIVVDGKFEKTTKGCPQGSPLSPMLSNIVLNELRPRTRKKRP